MMIGKCFLRLMKVRHFKIVVPYYEVLKKMNIIETIRKENAV